LVAFRGCEGLLPAIPATVSAAGRETDKPKYKYNRCDDPEKMDRESNRAEDDRQ
jgi:hypothetical protein